MSRYEAIQMVKRVIEDGSRNDRYLRVSEDGEYYTTPDRTYLTNEWTETPPFVKIPVGGDISEYDAEQWAESLLNELDELDEQVDA